MRERRRPRTGQLPTQQLLLLLVLLLATLHRCQGVYFLLEKSTPKRCFVEERPEETLLQIQTNFLDYAEGRALEVVVEPYSAAGGPSLVVRDRRGGVSPAATARYHVMEPQHTREFEVPESGVYSICVGVRGTPPSGPWRVELVVGLGPDDESYEALAEKENLDAVQVQLARLNDRVMSIRSEADYMKDKEVEFHRTSVQMNSTALWWPMVQMCILLVAGFFQVQYLKSFFKKRKLI